MLHLNEFIDDNTKEQQKLISFVRYTYDHLCIFGTKTMKTHPTIQRINIFCIHTFRAIETQFSTLFPSSQCPLSIPSVTYIEINYHKKTTHTLTLT